MRKAVHPHAALIIFRLTCPISSGWRRLQICIGPRRRAPQAMQTGNDYNVTDREALAFGPSR
jgi:hypothetical protein